MDVLKMIRLEIYIRFLKIINYNNDKILLLQKKLDEIEIVPEIKNIFIF